MKDNIVILHVKYLLVGRKSKGFARTCKVVTINRLSHCSGPIFCLILHKFFPFGFGQKEVHTNYKIPNPHWYIYFLQFMKFQFPMFEEILHCFISISMEIFQVPISHLKNSPHSLTENQLYFNLVT